MHALPHDRLDHALRFYARGLPVGLEFGRHLGQVRMQSCGRPGVADGGQGGGVSLDDVAVLDDPDRRRHPIEQGMKAALAPARIGLGQ